ncbi:MAG: phosphoribosylformylglycinamidine cyclo-ligase [Candidatus Micrarchaeia archaeon]|jgi:phosphoribosylformylglycinamidine cyclo-ligase
MATKANAKDELTYSKSGVDRQARAAAKDFSAFGRTLTVGTFHTPYLNLIKSGDTHYSALLADGVGTKVLLAQLADKHDTIGIDGVAMVANDAARCGLDCRLLVDIIDIHHSDKALILQIISGIEKGAKLAGCAVVGGETADVPTLVAGVGKNPYNLNFSLYADADKDEVIYGTGIKPGDVILGIESSGIHSNGFSLVRKVLFSQWDGYYKDPFAKVDGLDKSLVETCLEPTRIYSKIVRAYHADTYHVKAGVHITGDAYPKFEKLFLFNKGIGLEFDNFSPQPIFGVLQDTARKLGKVITDEEMLRTFNMGWGFAIILSAEHADNAQSFISSKGFKCERIGKVNSNAGRISAKYKARTFNLV